MRLSWKVKNRGLRCPDCAVLLVDVPRSEYRNYRVFECPCGERWAFTYKGWHSVNVADWNAGVVMGEAA